MSTRWIGVVADCAIGATAVSGWRYFNGEYSGFELTVKDKTRFKDPGGWVYLKFGESLPWGPTAKPSPAGACNACHDKRAADDLVFTQFYPILRDNDLKLRSGPGKGVLRAVRKKAKAVPRKQLPAVKTDKNSDDGKGWFWVEFTSTKNVKKVRAPPGKGIALCTGCHQTGRDFVLSQLPK